MIDQLTAHHLFEYKDGNLYWKNPVHKKNLGKIVGYDNGYGYKKVDIKGKQYYVHRIVYLMQHDMMPKLIDHIDGNPSNNAIENLREANNSQNMMNSFQKANNLSGHRNVRYNKDRHNYSVYITLSGKQKFFGSYDDVELAALVADEARRKHHGEFFFARSAK
jgi:hypothetical protein